MGGLECGYEQAPTAPPRGNPRDARREPQPPRDEPLGRRLDQHGHQALLNVGQACEQYQDKALRGLKARHIQCDEIWSFGYAKAKNVPESMKGAAGVGDVWTWLAIDADTKLVPPWAVRRRDGFTAAFIRDLAGPPFDARRSSPRTATRSISRRSRVPLGNAIDYAMLVKTNEGDSGKKVPAERKYSPAVCTGEFKQKITGDPDPDYVSTSYVERQNLTMRMHMRRFTRLTNAFSKKVDNHKAAIALHYMHYNFARIHKSLRVTPAMEAGVSDHVCELEEIIRLAA